MFRKKTCTEKIRIIAISLAISLVIWLVCTRYTIAKCNTSYRFIDASEVCYRDVIKKTSYFPMQVNLQEYIDNQLAAGNVTGVSVYFRDLENGPMFGINETDDFAPASLLKLPVALYYLDQAENNPGILQEQLFVSEPQWSFTSYFSKNQEIDPKVPHTTEDLLARMIEYSDNNAYGVLQTHLYDTNQENKVTQVFLELGFINPTDTNDEVISVRRYASIFSVLYHLAFLNAKYSEKVLEWLANTTFTQGLAGGVPEGIKVAHKFGERVTTNGKKQLHDCGIIYYPKNPYTLCVMTKGNDFDELASVVRHISEEVYKEVNSRRL